MPLIILKRSPLFIANIDKMKELSFVSCELNFTRVFAALHLHLHLIQLMWDPSADLIHLFYTWEVLRELKRILANDSVYTMLTRYIPRRSKWQRY